MTQREKDNMKWERLNISNKSVERLEKITQFLKVKKMINIDNIY